MLWWFSVEVVAVSDCVFSDVSVRVAVARGVSSGERVVAGRGDCFVSSWGNAKLTSVAHVITNPFAILSNQCAITASQYSLFLVFDKRGVFVIFEVTGCGRGKMVCAQDFRREYVSNMCTEEMFSRRKFYRFSTVVWYENY